MLTLALGKCYCKALISDDKVSFSSEGIFNMLRDFMFFSEKHIPLVTAERSSLYTLTHSVRCYGLIAIRFAQGKRREKAIETPKEGLHNSSANCEDIADTSSLTNPIKFNYSNI
jgi:hypothetical protein